MGVQFPLRPFKMTQDEKNPEELKLEDLSYLWETYRAELQDLWASIEFGEPQDVKRDLADLLELEKGILSRSYYQRLEFYNDLRREQYTAIQSENYEEAEDLKQQLIYYSHAFLIKPKKPEPRVRRIV